jgi:hypothetical protein
MTMGLIRIPALRELATHALRWRSSERNDDSILECGRRTKFFSYLLEKAGLCERPKHAAFRAVGTERVNYSVIGAASTR